MFRSKKRAASGDRDRVGAAIFKIFGPATVEGALQGHDPEARQAWKNLLENAKRERAEAKRQHNTDLS